MKMKILSINKILLTLALLLVFVSFVDAADLTSTSFIIKDPVVGTGSGYGSSTGFQLISSGDTSLNGANSSTSFVGRYGFLYYPFVSAAVLVATPNAADADLTWTSSDAGQGWTVGGYNTGTSLVPGGPYSYTDVGLVTSYTYPDLAPGDYCFVVQTYDNLGYVIATSNEECITIEAVIVFDLDTASGGGNGESGAPYSVGLGSISAGSARVSGTTDGVSMIVVEGDTNATYGMVITVRNVNGSSGLVSASVPADNINSSDGTISAGTENYGLCVATAGLTGFARATPYDSGSCAVDSETNDIQGLTTTGESIVNSVSSPVYGAHAEIVVNSAISPVTPAHSDYSDTLTFIATSTF